MKKKGFTLVELLVVIAILAILATVSIVGYTQFIAKSRQSVCLQEATQVRDLLIAEDINNEYFTIEGNDIKLTKCNAAGTPTDNPTQCSKHTGEAYQHNLSWEDEEVASTEFINDLGNLVKNIKIVETDSGVATFYYVTEGYQAEIKFVEDIKVETAETLENAFALKATN